MSYQIIIDEKGRYLGISITSEKELSVSTGQGSWIHSEGQGVSRVLEEIDRYMKNEEERHEERMDYLKNAKKCLEKKGFISEIIKLLS